MLRCPRNDLSANWFVREKSSYQKYHVMAVNEFYSLSFVLFHVPHFHIPHFTPRSAVLFRKLNSAFYTFAIFRILPVPWPNRYETHKHKRKTERIDLSLSNHLNLLPICGSTCTLPIQKGKGITIDLKHRLPPYELGTC